MSDMSRCFFCICMAYRYCSFLSLRTTHELPALQPSHPDAQKEARSASFSCARHTEVTGLAIELVGRQEDKHLIDPKDIILIVIISWICQGWWRNDWFLMLLEPIDRPGHFEMYQIGWCSGAAPNGLVPLGGAAHWLQTWDVQHISHHLASSHIISHHPTPSHIISHHVTHRPKGGHIQISTADLLFLHLMFP